MSENQKKLNPFQVHDAVAARSVSHIENTEANLEQNYNMVGDGLINNLAAPRADLTDGQTYEEIRELAPETLPGAEPVRQMVPTDQPPGDIPGEHSATGPAGARQSLLVALEALKTLEKAPEAAPDRSEHDRGER